MPYQLRPRSSRLERPPGLDKLLLLLHLLEIESRSAASWDLLSTLDQHAPVVGDGRFSVQCRRLLIGLDMNRDVELALRAAAEDAVRGGDVGVVATDGRADVAVVGDQVIGGVEADPAQIREQNIHPGVRGIGGGAVMIVATSLGIPVEVARREATMARQQYE